MKDYFNIERIMTFCNYVFYFLCINIFCIILNFPLVLFIVFIGIKQILVYLPLFILCCIPLPISFCASFYSMGKLIKNKDLNVFKDFFKALKTSFFQATFIGIIYLIIIFILSNNIIYVSKNNISLSLLFFFIIFLAFVILSSINSFLLISKFSIKTIQVLKYSFIITFTKPTLTLANGFCLVFGIYIFTLYPLQMFFFIFSLIFFFIYLINRHFLAYLQEKNYENK